MPNDYFQFKQFIIHQGACSMKVCTDACILGAWFASKKLFATSILDIGSGTGLLMLMLAQKINAKIQGIEIDPSSFQQLKENTQQSKWSNRLQVSEGDVRSFLFETAYDFIICNPPFFENDLASLKEEEQVAKHSKLLTLEELITVIEKNLSEHGSFGILLPYHRVTYFNELAASKKFYPIEILLVKQTPGHNYFRAIVQYSRTRKNNSKEFELIIKQEDGKYSTDFIDLMKDYYLML